jgi:hypothetical protein
MRGFLAVFEREVIERRLVFLVSLVLGLVPLVAPLLPQAGQRGGSDVRNAVAVALALSFSLIIALILGGTIIVRDLAEGRLGFYFSRPIRGSAVWAGKMAAVALLALTAGALILLPTAAVERSLDVGAWWSFFGPLPDGTVSVLLWVVLVLFLIVVGHAAGVALRSRSRWLILDLAGLGLISWLAWATIRRLAFEGALGAAEVVVMALLIVGLLGLIAAGAVQVLKGRTDVGRGHRLLSLTLWGILLAGTFGAWGFASWVLAAEPAGLDRVGVAGAASRSPWIAIFGPAEHRMEYTPEFLLDTSSGRFARVKFLLSPRFSADGRWAVWLEPAKMRRNGIDAGPFELLRMDLRAPESQPERTRMTYAVGAPPILAVSPDGRRVAVAAGQRLTLEELPGGRLLASAELPRELDHVEDALFFVAPGRVRIFGYEIFSPAGSKPSPGALEVGEIQVSGGGLRRVARIEQLAAPEAEDDPWAPARPEISVDGARLLVRRASDQRFLVLDAGSGAVLAELPPADERASASFLADGRIALVSGSLPRELRIFSRDYVPERSFRFAGSGIELAGQPAPHQLAVATSPTRLGVSLGRGEVLILDLATGSSRRLGTGLVPVANPHFGPENVATALFWRNANGAQLVHVDLATGRERVVAGRPPG